MRLWMASLALAACSGVSGNGSDDLGDGGGAIDLAQSSSQSDFSVGRDLSMADLRASGDLASPDDLASPSDLEAPSDLAAPADLEAPLDFATARDLAVPPDLRAPLDLAGRDLATPADLALPTTAGNLTCSPPSSGSMTPIGCSGGHGCSAVAPGHYLFGASTPVTERAGAMMEGEQSTLLTPDGHLISAVISATTTTQTISVASAASLGGTFKLTSLLGNNQAASDPVMAIDSGARVYLVWVGFDGAGSNMHLYLSTSDDGGQSWTAPKAIEDTSHPPADKPWIAVGRNPGGAGDYVYATYMESSGATNTLRCIRSTDRGASFGASTQVNNNAPVNFINLLEISTDGSGALLATWLDAGNNLNGDTATRVWFGRSTDGAQSFANAAVSDSSEAVVFNDPTVSGSGMNVFVTYVAGNSSTGAWDVFTRRSSNGGSSFGAPIKVNDDSPSCATHFDAINRLDGKGNLHVLWIDNRTGGGATYWARLPSGASAFSANVMVSDQVWPNFQDDHQTAGNQWLGDYESLYLTSTTMVAAWTDVRSGNSATYYATAPLP